MPKRGLPADVILIVRSRAVSPLTLTFVAAFLTLGPPILSTSDMRLRWGQYWLLGTNSYILITLAFLALVGGLQFGTWRQGDIADHHKAIVDIPVLMRLARILLLVFLTAYGVWLASAVSHGFRADTLFNILSGEQGAIYRSREQFATIAGVTTFTQIGPYLCGLQTILWRLGQPILKELFIVLLLSVGRMLANSERLGLLEVLAPLFVAGILTSRRRASPFGKWMTRLAYLAVPFGGFVLFTVAERNRSWINFYSSRFDGGLLAFSWDRLLAYYASATNNSAIYAEYLGQRSLDPWLATRWLWSAPGGPEILSALGMNNPMTPETWRSILITYSNPEYNNTGSILPLVGELGLPCCLAAFGITGFVVGRLYARTCAGSIPALLAYSSIAVAFVELPRYPYFSSGRFVPLLLAIAVGTYVLRRNSREAQPPSPKKVLSP